MNYDEALAARDYYRKEQNDEAVAKSLDRLVILSQDQNQTKEHLRELGDLYLKMEKYKNAQETYEQFRLLFPGSEAPVIRYQEIRSHYLSLKEADRDQTETCTTLDLTKEYCELFKHEKAYVPQVKDIQQQCYLKLLDAELYTVDFYLNKYNYSELVSSLKAAVKRLKYIAVELVPAFNDPTLAPMLDTLPQLDAISEEHASSIYDTTTQITQKLKNYKETPVQEQPPHPRDRF